MGYSLFSITGKKIPLNLKPHYKDECQDTLNEKTKSTSIFHPRICPFMRRNKNVNTKVSHCINCCIEQIDQLMLLVVAWHICSDTLSGVLWDSN